MQFSLGGSLEQPKVQQQIALGALRQEAKWSRFPMRSVRFTNNSVPRFREFFEIKRESLPARTSFSSWMRNKSVSMSYPLSF
ncbi:hypothetical protein [Candidatus Flexifilum breve]|uniref:hypothetical protein n=1 Tax=Candidatus Flexifilum breve TaxID=3140694 RepID=UPI0031CCCBA0